MGTKSPNFVRSLLRYPSIVIQRNFWNILNDNRATKHFDFPDKCATKICKAKNSMMCLQMFASMYFPYTLIRETACAWLVRAACTALVCQCPYLFPFPWFLLANSPLIPATKQCHFNSEIFTYGDFRNSRSMWCSVLANIEGGSIEIINESVIDSGSGGVNATERGGAWDH